MARGRRKEHEADHVGACMQGDIEGFGRPQAADFDNEGHAEKKPFAQICQANRRISFLDGR
jgi:hypothetical protein